MTRIYTRGGDAGQTSLAGGQRLPKSDVRVDLYGEVDELNSLVGTVRAFLPEDDDPDGPEEIARLDDQLASLQASLLTLGGLLADPDRCEDVIREGRTVPDLVPDVLEGWIDAWDARLPALRSFVLPGGVPAGALLHLARTVCRRLERRAVAASETIAVPAPVLAWLNRLADYLFTAARAANALLGAPEEPWPPVTRPPAGAGAGTDAGADAGGDPGGDPGSDFGGDPGGDSAGDPGTP